jgi:ATPase subunit of ABC transporter with duplicated ATPase domains
MLCQTCGNETHEQGLFCLSCGTRVNKECPRCAEIVKLRAKVCRFCGYEFTAEEMAQIERDEQERQQQQQEQEAEQERRGREELERAEQERVQREKAERERAQREKADLEKRRREQEEFRRLNPPDKVSNWGDTLLECPQCSVLNSIRLENCRRCSASLKSARKVKNPYL